MKIIKSVSIISGIIILVALIGLFSVKFFKKEPKPQLPAGQLWVTVPSGVWLREEPNSTAKEIVRIPYHASVDIYDITAQDETISGITDRWAQITWNDKSGWVFRGFLTNQDPANRQESDQSYAGIREKLIGEWIYELKNDEIEGGTYTFLADGRFKRSIIYHPYNGEGKWALSDDGERIYISGNFYDSGDPLDQKKSYTEYELRILEIRDDYLKIRLSIDNTEDSFKKGMSQK